MTWQDRMKAAGWNAQSIYYWQHRDGRQLERRDNGYWYLSPVTGSASKLGKSMHDAFAIVLNTVIPKERAKA